VRQFEGGTVHKGYPSDFLSAFCLYGALI
jgi:hypothetical protein